MFSNIFQSCFNENDSNTIKCKEIKNGKLYNATLQLVYDNRSGNSCLKINKSNVSIIIDFPLESRDIMFVGAYKFLEWIDVAKNNSVNVLKELPYSPIESNVYWQVGNDFYIGRSPIKLSLIASIQNSGKNGILLLTYDKVTSTESRYIILEGTTFAINSAETYKLIKLLSGYEKTVKSIKESKKKQDKLFK